MHLHLEHADLVGNIFLACADELDLVARLDRSVHHLEICDDSAERIEHRVKDQSLERRVRIPFRSRHPLHDSVKHFLYALSCLSGSEQDFFRLASEKVDHLVCNNLDHR